MFKKNICIPVHKILYGGKWNVPGKHGAAVTVRHYGISGHSYIHTALIPSPPYSYTACSALIRRLYAITGNKNNLTFTSRVVNGIYLYSQLQPCLCCKRGVRKVFSIILVSVVFFCVVSTQALT